nr:unnamed protein product [Digitaria exilis]
MAFCTKADGDRVAAANPAAARTRKRGNANLMAFCTKADGDRVAAANPAAARTRKRGNANLVRAIPFGSMDRSTCCGARVVNLAFT